ncbi:response regulator transcription factor [Aquirufa sp. HETE-40SA]
MRPSPLIPISHLTYREIEIVQLIRRGYSTKEMATKLGLSYFTVKKHRENILLKVGARGKTEFRKFVFEFEFSPKQAE